MSDKITGKGYVVNQPVTVTYEDLFYKWDSLQIRFSNIKGIVQNQCVISEDEVCEWSDMVDQILYEAGELQNLTTGLLKHFRDNNHGE